MLAIVFVFNAFAVGESLFFASAQRKVTKRKGASPTQQSRHVIGLAIFRLAIHGSVDLSKLMRRRTSCAAPSGSASRFSDGEIRRKKLHPQHCRLRLNDKRAFIHAKCIR
jgi:hypothetical protein